MANGVTVPSDFPQVTITARGNPAADYIWLENVGQNGQSYNMILDTWGTGLLQARGSVGFQAAEERCDHLGGLLRPG